ncbi:MAG: hypothetical protein JNJ73_02460 [Hyphomonadaceae bacterium]|nr:hypothetical protein [Hyphomonadaceae bacterium]
MSAAPVSPDHIMQVGLGFWASKTLLSAVELELFTRLAEGPKTGGEIERALGLNPRGTADFLDSLVALGLLERSGEGAGARYANTPATDVFLDKKKPSYIGGILEMANARLYPFWADLTEALKTGKPQNESKRGGRGLFEELYEDPARLEQFMDAMSGASAGNFMAFAEKFDFSKYKTLADVGGAAGLLASFVARRHPHMTCVSYDLPGVTAIAKKRLATGDVAARATAETLDFFNDPLPKADVITMGMILHDWGLETKKMLIGKAYAALPEGGAFVAIEQLIDDARRKNATGLLMSLNMLIETPEGFDYTGVQFAEWCKDAGFRRSEVIPLVGAGSAAVAYK